METPLSPLEFARRARQLYPARDAVVDRIEGLNAGADDYNGASFPGSAVDSHRAAIGQSGKRGKGEHYGELATRSTVRRPD